jgi:hypothetical protein
VLEPKMNSTPPYVCLLLTVQHKQHRQLSKMVAAVLSWQQVQIVHVLGEQTCPQSGRSLRDLLSAVLDHLDRPTLPDSQAKASLNLPLPA